ncbi:MAG: hypothetical protein OSB62_02255 [Alphaproteobacteria bacterium]|nr:hypothetical protein [Alphaproteobacteria bacterium]
MTNLTFIDGTNEKQISTISQMEDQGFQLMDANAPFNEKLGVVPMMKRNSEQIYILVCGDTCSEEEWQNINGEKAA